MKHEGPTRRLFALLLDPDVVETQAIGEVHEDLAVLGIDPAEAIAIAERLAACAPSPAVKLLARLAESDLEVDEGQGWSAPDHRLRQARPPNVPRRARVPRRWIYGLGAAAASVALLISLNLIGVFGCSWPWPLLPSSRECYLRVIPDRPTLAAVWILNSERVPAALRNSSLQQSDLLELLDEAKLAAEGREIVAIFSVRHPDGTLSDSALLSEAKGATHVSEVVNARTIAEAMLAAVKKQRDELARRYGDKDADVIELQRRIDELNSALLSNAKGATHGFEVANAWTTEVGNTWTIAEAEDMLAVMKKQRDILARLSGDKGAEVIELQRQIDGLRRYIGKRNISAVSADTLAALERVAGPVPDNLVVLDLLPR